MANFRYIKGLMNDQSCISKMLEDAIVSNFIIHQRKPAFTQGIAL